MKYLATIAVAALFAAWHMPTIEMTIGTVADDLAVVAQVLDTSK